MSKESKAKERDPFQAIADDAIAKAEAVSVPFHDFVAGMRTIALAVGDRAVLAEDEAKSMRAEEP